MAKTKKHSSLFVISSTCIIVIIAINIYTDSIQTIKLFKDSIKFLNETSDPLGGYRNATNTFTLTDFRVYILKKDLELGSVIQSHRNNLTSDEQSVHNETIFEYDVHSKMNIVNSSRTFHYISIQPNRFHRLGNQMFMLASLKGLAQRMDRKPVFQSPILKYFESPYVLDITLTNVVDKHEEAFAKYTEISDVPNKNITLRGFFQSWKYFNSAENTVREALTIKQEYVKEPLIFLQNISLHRYQKVGIHVRRNDLLFNSHQTRGFEVAGADFIDKAIRYFKSLFEKVQFIIVTDDRNWCEQNIAHRANISPFKEAIHDMALMSLCDHMIITSGTFGWWGAWLANGTTVYFKGYPKENSELGNGLNHSDYYPPNWIGM